MGAISPLHVLIVIVVALVVLGPSRLPDTAASLGKAIRGFREAVNEPDDPQVIAQAPVAAATVAQVVAQPAAPVAAAPSAPAAPAPLAAAPAPLAAAPVQAPAAAPVAPAPESNATDPQPGQPPAG